MFRSAHRSRARWATSVGAVVIAVGAMTTVAASPAMATYPPKAKCPNERVPEPGHEGVPNPGGAICL
ncbi:hypothetical protein ACWGR4_33580 [Embleya sp. NPDC055664]|uniref:hypothetical protein n=1 Tax=Embleya sp. NPDC059237 TaxID=3346784 RepID=UPI00368B65AA